MFKGSTLIQKGWPPSLIQWFNKSTLDWNLGISLVHDFEQALGMFFFSLFGGLSPIFSPFLAGLGT